MDRLLPAPFRARPLLAALCLCGAALFAQAADPKASRFYEDALTRYEQRDYAGAIIQLKNALQVDKSLLPVHVLLGRALLASGDVVAAEVAFTEALRLGVNRAEVVLPLARAIILQGRPREVLEQPRFATAGLPSAVQATLLIVKSTAAADIGDARAALRAVEDARTIDPGSPDSWLAEVPLRIRARQFAQALAAVDRAQALAPQRGEVHYQRGSVLHVQGDRAGALAAYDKALALETRHLEARLARAGLNLDLKREAEVAKDLDQLKLDAPNEPRAAYLRAVLAEQRGERAAAEAALRALTGLLDPVPVEFLRYRSQLMLLNGLAHFSLGEREKARPYLEAFQNVQGASPVGKLLAQIHIADGNIDSGIEVLETYLRAQPGDAQALALLASAQMARGRHARATALIQEALRERDLPELNTVLGTSLMRSGQTRGAIEQFERALKKDPTQAQAATALVGLYLQQRQTQKALTLAQSLVKRDARNPGFATLLGHARAQAKDRSGARSAYEQALALDPKLASAQLSLARLDIADQAWDAATRRLTALVQANEGQVDVLFEMARLHDRRGQPAEAQRWLEKAIDHSGPNELRPALALIDLHLRNGRRDAALEVAKTLNAKAPDALPALVAMARVQLAVGDASGARVSLGNATRVAAYAAPAQVEIAGLQVMAQNLPGALYSVEKALSDQPGYLPALALQAEVLARQGDHARAEQLARQIVQKHPERAVGHSLLGAIAASRGQTGPAIEAYRQAHRVEPGTDTLLRLFRMQLGVDRKVALQLAEQWLNSRPADRVVRQALAEAYVRGGNLAQARAAYEALVKRSPDDADALNNLANVLLRLKDPAASKVADQALALRPTSAFIIDTAGWAAFQAGQTDRALQLLRDARLRDPASAATRYHLAAVLARTGRAEEARTELEAALQMPGGFDGMEDARALLRTLR